MHKNVSYKYLDDQYAALQYHAKRRTSLSKLHVLPSAFVNRLQTDSRASSLIHSFGKKILDPAYRAARERSFLETGCRQPFHGQPGLDILGRPPLREACGVERQDDTDGGVQRIQADEDEERDFGDAGHEDGRRGLLTDIGPRGHDARGQAQRRLRVQGGPGVGELVGVGAEGRYVRGDFEVAEGEVFVRGGGDDAAEGRVRGRHGERFDGAVCHGVVCFIDRGGAVEDPGHASMHRRHDVRIVLEGDAGGRLSGQVALSIDSCPSAEVVGIQVSRSEGDVGDEGIIR